MDYYYLADYYFLATIRYEKTVFFFCLGENKKKKDILGLPC